MSYRERVGRFSDDLDLLAQGEINPVQVALRGAGEGAGLVGDAVGAAVAPLIPEFVEEGIAQVVQGVMDTGPAKIAMAWMEKNPEHARDIVSVLNVGSLMGAAPAQGAKGALKAFAHNAPNKLEGFYGSGKVGQAAAPVRAIPNTMYHAAKDAFTPQGQANMAAGVPSQLKSVAKQHLKTEGTPDMNKSASFVEGQLDQTSLLHHGSGTNPAFLDDTFRSVQDLNVAPLSPESLKAGHRNYKPDMYAPQAGLLDDVMEQFEPRVRDAWGIKGKEKGVTNVTRHPTAFSDIATEGTLSKQASRTASGMYTARKAIQDAFPGKTKFDSLEEVREFMAAKDLVDKTLVRTKDGKPMSMLDDYQNKYLGDSSDPAKKRFKPKEKGLNNIREYYQLKAKVYKGPEFSAAEEAAFKKLRDRVDRGEKLPKTTQQKLERFMQREDYGEVSPAQIEKYKKFRKRLHEAEKKYKIDEEAGLVLTKDSHKSAAKGLGGVNDQFATNLQGDVVSLITDENDLFGLKLPGDNRVVSSAPPTHYNVFTDKEAVVDKAGAANKIALRENLAQNYGAADRGGKAAQMLTQMADATSQYNAPVTMQNYGAAGHNAGRVGLLGLLGAEPDEGY